MTYDKMYYQNKKQTLQQRNQKVTQKFLGDTMAYAQAISEIEQDFQEILKMEAEQKPKKEPKEEIVPIPKDKKR